MLFFEIETQVEIEKQKVFAALAHLVEQLTCNHQVASSIPAGGTN
jgi:hypothetical protein